MRGVSLVWGSHPPTPPNYKRGSCFFKNPSRPAAPSGGAEDGHPPLLPKPRPSLKTPPPSLPGGVRFPSPPLVAARARRPQAALAPLARPPDWPVPSRRRVRDPPPPFPPLPPRAASVSPGGSGETDGERGAAATAFLSGRARAFWAWLLGLAGERGGVPDSLRFPASFSTLGGGRRYREL